MAITSAVCDSYKLEVLQGIHQEGDDYRIALFTGAATIGADTTAYDSANEAAGLGYVAGGMSLSGITMTLAGGVAFIDWDDPTWPAATVSASGALIYNASRADRAVAVLSFGGVVSSAGPYTVILPAPGSATAVIRIA